MCFSIFGNYFLIPKPYPEGAMRELCRGADPKAREKAGELFDAIVVGGILRNTNPGR